MYLQSSQKSSEKPPLNFCTVHFRFKGINMRFNFVKKMKYIDFYDEAVHMFLCAAIFQTCSFKASV